MPLLPYLGAMPEVAENVMVDDGGFVIGKVKIGSGSRIGSGAIVRGDQCYIEIGRRFTLGGNATVHVDPARPALLGDDIVVEDRAVVHACTMGDAVLVQRKATVLSGSVIGEGSIIQSGALVAEGKEIPPRSVVAGTPGKIVRQSTDEEVAETRRRASAVTRASEP